jgi:hypothetical protein
MFWLHCGSFKVGCEIMTGLYLLKIVHLQAFELSLVQPFFSVALDETRKAKANCLAFVGLETESMYEVPTP